MNDIHIVTGKLYLGKVKKLCDTPHAGTAWLCSRNYALTAAHCITENKDYQATERYCTIYLDNKPIFTEFELINGLDVALLSITESSIDKLPKDIDGFPLAFLPEALNESGKEWEAYGFPSGKPDGQKVGGKIRDQNGAYGSFSQLIQLYCDEGGQGGFDGLSGSAIIYNGSAVGILTWNPEAYKAKVLYAFPLSQIVEQCDKFKKIFEARPTKQFSSDSSFIFNKIIDDNTRHFVGRKIVFQKLSSFENQYTRGYFHIQADAGLGKTALAAEITKRYNAFAFFMNRSEGRTTTEKCLKHLSAQIIHRFNLPFYALPVSEDSSKLSNFFSEEILTAAAKKTDGSIWIVIDALDEADSVKGQNILLLPNKLPDKVYIVLTFRPGDYIFPTDPETPNPVLFKISWNDDFQNKDIRDYLVDQLRRDEIRRALTKNTISEERFITSLQESSQGNFMYLIYVLKDIAEGVPGFYPLQLEYLPTGLPEYYEKFWERMSELYDKYKASDKNTLANLFKPTIAALGAATEAVTVEWLALFTGQQDEQILNEVLKAWERFLSSEEREGQVVWRIVHRSFAEFLEKKEEVGLPATHKRIAQHYLTTWGGLVRGRELYLLRQNLVEKDKNNIYGFRNIVAHLVSAKEDILLYQLLKMEWMSEVEDQQPKIVQSQVKKYFLAPLQWMFNQFSKSQDVEITKKDHYLVNAWYQLHFKSDDIPAYLTDIDRALRRIEEASNHAIEVGQGKLIGLEIRYSLIKASLKSLSGNYPGHLLLASVSANMMTRAQALAYASIMRDEEQRAILLAGLAKDTNSNIKILEQVIRYASLITNPRIRASTLIDIASSPFMGIPYNTGFRDKVLHELWTTLENCLQISDEFLLANTLGEILDLLPENIIQLIPDSILLDTYQITSNISISTAKDSVRDALMPLLAAKLPTTVLDDISKNYAKPDWQLKDIKFLARNLSAELLEKAISLVPNIQSEGWRAEALLALSPSFVNASNPELLFDKMWDEIINKMKSNSSVETALIALAPYFSCSQKKFKERILDAFHKLESNNKKAKVLCYLAQYWNDSTERDSYIAAVIDSVSEMIKKARASSKKESMFRVIPLPEVSKPLLESLLSVIPDLPEVSQPLLEKALQYSDYLSDSSRATLFLKLANHLPTKQSALVEEVCAIVGKLSGDSRVNLLLALASYFPDKQEDYLREAWLEAWLVRDKKLLSEVDPLLPSNLKFTLQRDLIRKGGVTDNDLAMIMPFLSNELLDEVVPLVRKIRTKPLQLLAQNALIPRLNHKQLGEVLGTAALIGDSANRTVTILKLLPYCPENAIFSILKVLFADIVSVAQCDVIDGLTSLCERFIKERQLSDFGYKVVAAIMDNILEFSPTPSTAFDLLLSMAEQLFKNQILSNDSKNKIKGMTESKLILLEFKKDKVKSILDEEFPQHNSNQDSLMQKWNSSDIEVRRDWLIYAEIDLNYAKNNWDQIQTFPTVRDKIEVGLAFRDALLSNLKKLPDIASQLSESQLYKTLHHIRNLPELEDALTLQSNLVLLLPQHLRQEVAKDMLLLVKRMRATRDDRRKIYLPFGDMPVKDWAGCYQNSTQVEKKFQTNEEDEEFIIAKSLVELLKFDSPYKLEIEKEIAFAISVIANIVNDEASQAILLANFPINLPQECFEKILSWAIEHQDESILKRIAPQIRQKMNISESNKLWEEQLSVFSELERTDFLVRISRLAPFLSEVGGEQDIEEVCQAIQDVGRWWP